DADIRVGKGANQIEVSAKDLLLVVTGRLPLERVAGGGQAVAVAGVCGEGVAGVRRWVRARYAGRSTSTCNRYPARPTAASTAMSRGQAGRPASLRTRAST